ncbi:MAG: hypothetical protein ABIH72_04190 [archaeon]
MKKLAVMIFAILVSLNFISAFGFSPPIPNTFTLNPGNSANFTMRVYPDVDSNCSFYITENSPLELALPSSFVVYSNQSFTIIYGSVNVPIGLAPGNYTEVFCFDSKPLLGNVGIGVCGLKITVIVPEPPIQDADGDGIPDEEDFCPDTSGIALSKGCSCAQILELKPGKDTKEINTGCTEKTIIAFDNGISWAKKLF